MEPGQPIVTGGLVCTRFGGEVGAVQPLNAHAMDTALRLLAGVCHNAVPCYSHDTHSQQAKAG